MPDATGLELTAQELRDIDSETVLDTEFHRGRAVLVVNPERIRAVLTHLFNTPIEVLRASDGRLVVVGQPEPPAYHVDRHEHQ